MKLTNLLALENMGPVAPATVAEIPTASEGRTNPARRFTARIEAKEQREMMRRERIEMNTYHRNNAREYEREHYAALGCGTW